MPRKISNADVENNVEENEVGPEEVTSEAIDTAPAVGTPVNKFQEQIDDVLDRESRLHSYVKNHMTDEDYGKVPGFGDKKTLFKPGAEKLNAIFNVAPRIEIISQVEDWSGQESGVDGGFVSYTVKVKLVSYAPETPGVVMGEGVGLANSQDKMFKSRSAYLMANNVLKMAKKRALVDASLSNSLASGIFTQDLEDMVADNGAADAPKTFAPPPAKAAGLVGATSSPATNGEEVVIPFGQHKGMKLPDVPENNLSFYISAAVKNLNENKYVDSQVKFLKAAYAELDSRGVFYKRDPRV